MKKKSHTMTRRITSLFLVLVMMLSLIGCSKKSEDTTSSNINSGKETASTNEGATAQPESQDDNFNTTGMPIVDEPITLKVLTTRWGNMGDTFKNNEFIVNLSKDTNVQIEWQVQSLNDWEDQKGIYLAGGEMPDIIFGFRTFEDDDISTNLELFRPLNDLIENYMPNYKKALEETPEMKRMATFPDGNMYSLSKKLPMRPAACDQPVINKVWLDNLGLKVPTTIDELYTVLKAFKDEDANGNGDPDDEYGIAGSKNDIAPWVNFMALFGITDINQTRFMVNNDASISYYATTEAYKEAIKWLNKLYAEGIMDPESFTQDDTMLRAKREDPDAAKIGFAYCWSFDSLFGKWSDQYEVIPPIKGFDGKAYTSGDINGVSSIMRNEVLITKDCKYPEIAARWIDQFYTGEASIQNFWGGIGTVITKHDDGTYTLNAPPEGTSADAWYWDQSLRDFGPKYVSTEFEKKIKLDVTSGDGFKYEISKLADGTVTTPYPYVIFTKEENTELASLYTEIDKFVETKRATWIYSGGIDDEWDNYINQLNTMGLERLVQIYTDAYARYIGN